MNNAIDITQTVILYGRLANYRSERVTSDFILDAGGRQAMGLTAVAAALAGSGGAVGLAAIVGTREEMSKVQFELDGKRIEGWLMWSPFNEGDEVKVVAERARDGSYRAFAILRPVDQIVALYPHCSRGRFAHYKVSSIWFLKVLMPFYLMICLMLAIINAVKGGLTMQHYLVAIGGGLVVCIAIYGLVAFHISSKFMPFVRMAESIFTVLGWPNVKKIDLPARSKAQRKSVDTPGLGTLYFRY